MRIRKEGKERKERSAGVFVPFTWVVSTLRYKCKKASKTSRSKMCRKKKRERKEGKRRKKRVEGKEEKTWKVEGKSERRTSTD